MLMDYKKSPTKCSPNVKDACLIFCSLKKATGQNISQTPSNGCPCDIYQSHLHIQCQPIARMFSNRVERSKCDKSGDRHKVNNYRPVSVLPVLAKIFEGIVHDQLFGYLEKKMILCEEQVGFRPNRSTQDVLLRATDD